jgi:hypothetical protein
VVSFGVGCEVNKRGRVCRDMPTGYERRSHVLYKVGNCISSYCFVLHSLGIRRSKPECNLEIIHM